MVQNRDVMQCVMVVIDMRLESGVGVAHRGYSFVDTWNQALFLAVAHTYKKQPLAIPASSGAHEHTEEVSAEVSTWWQGAPAASAGYMGSGVGAGNA